MVYYTPETILWNAMVTLIRTGLEISMIESQLLDIAF